MLRNVQPTILIEGQSGSGKTTLAQLIAQRYGYANVNTGTLHRAAGLAVQLGAIAVPDIESFVRESHFVFDLADPMEPQIAVNGTDVTGRLQTPEATNGAVQLGSANAGGYLETVFRQHLPKDVPLVIDGKNLSAQFPGIGTHWYLHAKFQSRVIRKHQQALSAGRLDYSLSEAEHDMATNDHKDRGLLVLSEHVDHVLDTTRLTSEMVLHAVIGRSRIVE